MLNFDMTGPVSSDRYLPPDEDDAGSHPSYLNDLIATLLLFRRSEDSAQTATTRLQIPALPYIANPITRCSRCGHPGDAVQPLERQSITARGPRGDADPTQMKRVAFMGSAALRMLANAGPAEARALAWEAAANGEKWIAEVARQSVACSRRDHAAGSRAARERHRRRS